MADRNREQERRMTIDIMHETPIRRDDNWEFTIWAVVKEGNDPFEGAEVHFFRNTEEIGSKETTNSDGYTNPLPLSIPIEKPSIQIRVFAHDSSGRSVERKKEIILPRPTTLDKRADEWSTRVVGSEGEYTAYISVSNQNQIPLPGVLIHVYFDRGAQLAGSEYTKNDGLATISIPKFTESFKDIIIEAVGTRLKPEKKRLYRRHDRTPPPVPEPPEDIRQTSGLRGIFKAFLDGWKSGE